MALDGATLSFLKREIETHSLNARIDRLYQPSKEELIFVLRGRNGTYRLLLSARASSPRVHFTVHSPENPKTPPMLCMLLRKRLTGAKLVGLRQPGLERVLFLDFEATDDLGDKVSYTVAVEIMGRHSNIILIDSDGMVVDSVKRVDAEMSSVRPILPGVSYTLPPSQGFRLDLTTCTAEQAADALQTAKDAELSKALLGLLFGLSPIVCREIADFTGRGAALRSHSLTEEQRDRLCFLLRRVQAALDEGGVPTMVTANDTGKPLDFSFLPIHQYGRAATTREVESFSELLDEFYAERDRLDRIRSRAQDLLKLLTNASDRISRKISVQQAELAKCADRDNLRMQGDLLNANLHRMEKGMAFIDLENFYEDGYPTIRIPLDPAKPPVQNAQKYYKDYRRADTAEKMLTEQIEIGQRELEYIDTVFDELSRADTDRELSEIRQELAEQGYIKRTSSRQKQSAPLPPLEFIAPDGTKIHVGRNNRQNDQLTLRDAHSGDVWLHTRNIPGSHTVIRAAGKPVSEETMVLAATLAASHSRAKDSSQVPVDYTLIKNVKKPPGAKPGRVIYSDFKTLFVTPDASLAKQTAKPGV
ncbi:MAG: fibronectin/fibrinogen-binding protein [Clostridiales bacterium]|nr:fibronectin/fibrinogen-binding protein [Clostridiales bacterium]